MKKLLSLFMTLFLLLSLPGCAGILDGLLPDGNGNYLGDLYLQYEGEIGKEEVYVEDTQSYGYYYDQLPENSKTIYRSIYKDSKNTEGVSIIFRDALVFTQPKDSETDMEETVRSTISALAQQALDALLYDHPDIFWFSMQPNGGSTFRIITHEETNDNGQTNLAVKKLTFELVYKDGRSAEMIAEEAAALQNAVKDACLTIPEGSCRYEVLYALQEYLCQTVTYESEAARAHEAAGALLDGKAVCDGYAKAFKLLCDAQGIPCLIIPGQATQNGRTEAHAWNYVQMENGKWYAVDVTWNDRGEEADTGYFLVGGGTVTSMTLGHFDNSHKALGKFSSGKYTPFTFPELSFFRFEDPILPHNAA